MSEVGVREGDIIAGKFRVERVLGRGGMGVVVAAHHIQLDTRVAIKFLLPSGMADQGAAARFLREAQAAAKITSEHVARVLDVAVLPTGEPFIVMEFLEGRDLAQQLRDEGPLPVALAIDSVMQACEALAEAHAMGIVHRDLKPANLFCARRPNGQVVCKVLDFGISKLTAGAAGGLAITATAALMGSPLYMSPEQMRSTKGADAQSDIWALGIVLFELLCGAPPFNGTTISEVAVKVATEPTPPMRMQRPDVPPELEAVVLRCLEKDRARRVRTVVDLARELAPFGSLRARLSLERIAGPSHEAGPLTPGPQRVATAIATVAAPGTAEWVGHTTNAPATHTRGPAQSSPRAIAWLVAAGAIFALACGAGVVWMRGQSAGASHARDMPLPETLRAGVATVPDAPAASAAATALASDRAPAMNVDGGHELAAPAPSAAASAPQARGSAASPGARIPPSLHGSPARPAGPASSPSAAPGSSPANCDPPYYLDAQGNRIFKRECVN
jgi:predicted Ser/Thr protein kinase